MAPSLTQLAPGEPPAPKSALLHRNLRSAPLTITHGQGQYLTTSSGRQIWDTTCGAAVSCLGATHPRVTAAVAAQMNAVPYVNTLMMTNPAPEALSRLLVESTHGSMARAFIVNSGSEAMECAMKLARQFFLEKLTPEPRRVNFIARANSYHGTTLGGLSMSGHVARRANFEPMLLRNVSHVSPCSAYRMQGAGESNDAFVSRLAHELEAEFQRLGPETVVAFVAEPVVGAAMGCVPAVEGYFHAIKAVCERHGALLILDEVMCGMGRSGTLHAWEQEGVVPDIQTMGKGLGGGFAPIAAVLASHRVIDSLQSGTGAFVHGHTYQAHPVGCAAALEVQKIIREEGLVENVARQGEALGRLLRERLDGHAHVGNVRGKGLFWGIELVKDKATKEPFDPKLGLAGAMNEAALQEPWSFALYPGGGTKDGRSGDHLMLAPAYTVTEDEVRRLVDLTGRFVEWFFSEKLPSA